MVEERSGWARRRNVLPKARLGCFGGRCSELAGELNVMVAGLGAPIGQFILYFDL